MGFGVKGLGFRGQGAEFRVRVSGLQVWWFWVAGSGWVSGFGFRVSGFGFRVSGLGFRVSGLGSRVSGFGSRVTGRGGKW